MHRTIFTTPVVNTLLRAGSIAFLKWKGWTIEGNLPAQQHKCVLIAAPHTSNWDLPYTLMVAFSLRLTPYWMGKSQIFRFPFGGIMRWLGGISVNRDQSTNLVAASAAALVEADGAVQLIVPPEGTRSKTRYWKTGFYWIAPHRQGAHRDGVYGLRAQAQRTGPRVHSQRRYRSGHGQNQGLLRAVQRQELATV